MALITSPCAACLLSQRPIDPAHRPRVFQPLERLRSLSGPRLRPGSCTRRSSWPTRSGSERRRAARQPGIRVGLIEGHLGPEWTSRPPAARAGGRGGRPGGTRRHPSSARAVARPGGGRLPYAGGGGDHLGARALVASACQADLGRPHAFLGPAPSPCNRGRIIGSRSSSPVRVRHDGSPRRARGRPRPTSRRPGCPPSAPPTAVEVDNPALNDVGDPYVLPVPAGVDGMTDPATPCTGRPTGRPTCRPRSPPT